MVQAAAYGKISLQREYLNGKKITAANVIITIKKVLIPGAKDRQGNRLSEYQQVPFEIIARICDLRTSHPINFQGSENVAEETDQINIDIPTTSMYYNKFQYEKKKKKLTVQLEINENEQGDDGNNNLQDHDYINNHHITAILEDNTAYHNQHLNESEVQEEVESLEIRSSPPFLTTCHLLSLSALEYLKMFFILWTRSKYHEDMGFQIIFQEG